MIKRRLVIIGGGSAGMAAAIKAYELGERDILIVDREIVGIGEIDIAFNVHRERNVVVADIEHFIKGHMIAGLEIGNEITTAKVPRVNAVTVIAAFLFPAEHYAHFLRGLCPHALPSGQCRYRQHQNKNPIKLLLDTF